MCAVGVHCGVTFGKEEQESLNDEVRIGIGNISRCDIMGSVAKKHRKDQWCSCRVTKLKQLANGG